jgi:multidrug efflux system membrane fusion protein
MRNLCCLLLILFTLPLSGCGKSAAAPSTATEPLRPVKTMRVAITPSEASLQLAGEVRARHEAPLAFRVGGKITECRVNHGDTVKAGQVLARLEPTDYQLAAEGSAASAAEARSAAILADADLTRFRALHEKGFVSAAALDQKQAAADAAHARLTAMQSAHSEQSRKLDYATLTADSDGIISGYDCNVGQVVNIGQPVLRLAQSGAREIGVNVAEGDLPLFRKNKSFTIALNALPDKTYSGTLRELAGAADPATRTYGARIAVRNADGDMQLGMSATVTVRADNGASMRLPLSAVISQDSNPSVWKVAADGIVHRASVTVAGVDGNDVRVAEGLAEGDMVVVAGASLLREGEQVKLMP